MDHLLRILGLCIILNEKLCVRSWGFASMDILKKHTDTKQNICYGCMYWYRVFSGNVETTDISIGVCVGIVCTLTFSAMCHMYYLLNIISYNTYPPVDICASTHLRMYVCGYKLVYHNFSSLENYLYLECMYMYTFSCDYNTS